MGEPRWPNPSTLPTDYRFTGQRSEEASLGSLYDCGARFCSPALGRFLSPDSIVPQSGDPQCFNRYAYTRNNPLRYTDPTGHCMELGISPIPCSLMLHEVAERGPSFWQQVQALAVLYGPIWTQSRVRPNM